MRSKDCCFDDFEQNHSKKKIFDILENKKEMGKLPMKIIQLEYFCAVCRYHSITQAAQKLSTKASSEPLKPKPATNQISPLPTLPTLNGRTIFGILYRNMMADANISRYIIRYNSTVSCESIW